MIHITLVPCMFIRRLGSERAFVLKPASDGTNWGLLIMQPARWAAQNWTHAKVRLEQKWSLAATESTRLYRTHALRSNLVCTIISLERALFYANPCFSHANSPVPNTIPRAFFFFLTY